MTPIALLKLIIGIFFALCGIACLMLLIFTCCIIYHAIRAKMYRTERTEYGTVYWRNR